MELIVVGADVTGPAVGGADVTGAAAAAAAGEIGASVCIPVVASLTLVGAGVLSVTMPLSTILITTFSLSG